VDNFIPSGILLAIFLSSAWSVGETRRKGTMAGSWSRQMRADSTRFPFGCVVDKGYMAHRMNDGRALWQIIFWGIVRWLGACSTNSILALLQSFEYPLQSEDDGESESLEQIGAYASHTSFVNDGLPAHGYGVLSQPILPSQSQPQSQSQSQSHSQSRSSIPWQTAKGLRYPNHSGIHDGPP
jgi:hypothetical protein